MLSYAKNRQVPLCQAKTSSLLPHVGCSNGTGVATSHGSPQGGTAGCEAPAGCAAANELVSATATQTRTANLYIPTGQDATTTCAVHPHCDGVRAVAERRPR